MLVLLGEVHPATLTKSTARTPRIKIAFVFKLFHLSPSSRSLFETDVQPLIDTRTRAPINSNGNAYLSGVLTYRFIIRVIGFILHPPLIVKQIRKTGSMKLKSCYLPSWDAK